MIPERLSSPKANNVSVGESGQVGQLALQGHQVGRLFARRGGHAAQGMPCDGFPASLSFAALEIQPVPAPCSDSARIFEYFPIASSENNS